MIVCLKYFHFSYCIFRERCARMCRIEDCAFGRYSIRSHNQLRRTGLRSRSNPGSATFAFMAYPVSPLSPA
jgi:hypothetical protein